MRWWVCSACLSARRTKTSDVRVCCQAMRGWGAPRIMIPSYLQAAKDMKSLWEANMWQEKLGHTQNQAQSQWRETRCEMTLESNQMLETELFKHHLLVVSMSNTHHSEFHMIITYTERPFQKARSCGGKKQKDLTQERRGQILLGLQFLSSLHADGWESVCHQTPKRVRKGLSQQILKYAPQKAWSYYALSLKDSTLQPTCDRNVYWAVPTTPI